MYSGFDISNKICLITGGTSGIGRSIALGFAQAGATVIAASSSQEKVAAMRDELRSTGQDHDALQMDVVSETNVGQAIDQIISRHKRLDVLVHAAGVISLRAAIDLSIEEFRRVVDVNLTGSFIVARAAVRAMIQTKTTSGSIVLIASLNSFVSLREVLAYAASKCGVLGLVRRPRERMGRAWRSRKRDCAGRFSHRAEPIAHRKQPAWRMAQGSHTAATIWRNLRAGRRRNLPRFASRQLYHRPDSCRGWRLPGPRRLASDVNSSAVSTSDRPRRHQNTLAARDGRRNRLGKSVRRAWCWI